MRLEVADLTAYAGVLAVGGYREAERVSVNYTLDIDGHGVFCGRVSLKVRRFTLLVGPNGVGKSLVMLLSWCLDNALAAGFSRYLVSGFEMKEFQEGVLSAFRELVESVVGIEASIRLGIRVDVGRLEVSNGSVSIEYNAEALEKVAQSVEEKLREYAAVASGGYPGSKRLRRSQILSRVRSSSYTIISKHWHC